MSRVIVEKYRVDDNGNRDPKGSLEVEIAVEPEEVMKLLVDDNGAPTAEKERKLKEMKYKPEWIQALKEAGLIS